MSWRIERVRTRLLVGFGLAIVVLFAAGLLGIRAMSALRQDVQNDIGAAAAVGTRLGLIGDATLRQVVMAQSQLMGGATLARDIADSLALLADSLRRRLITEADLGTNERTTLETIGALQGRVEVRLAAARAYLTLGRSELAFGQAGLAAATLDTLMIASDAIRSSQTERMRAALANVDGLVQRRRTALAILLLVGLGAALAAGFATWRSVTRPIDALVRAAEGLGAGRLRVALNPRGLDREFRTVVTALKDTASRLGELVSEIQREATTLSEAAETLDATSGQTADSTGQVSAAMSEVALDADRQRQELTASAESLEEAGSATTHTELAATEARAVSAEIRRTSEATANQIGTALDTLRKTRGILENSSTRIAALESASASIDGFIKVVRRVADQTELLALNASIEAARAREHGRGFAVVAHEVRTLAVDSAEAARQTESVVRQLRARLRETVTSFEDGLLRLGDVGSVSEKAAVALGEVDEAVRKVETVTVTIHEAATRGRGAMTSLKWRLDNIGTQAEQQAAASQQAAAATQETAAASQEVSATAKALHQTAERLLELVRRFEV